MMKVRKETPNAWSLVLAAGLVACGAGSALDDYSDGVPDIVPQPIVDTDDDGGSSKDGGASKDGGTSKDGGAGDSGSKDGGQAGGAQGGGQQGGAEIGDSCEDNNDCAAGGNCLTTVDLLSIIQLEFTGGYCSKMGCSNDSQCPEGSGCQTITMTCLQKCTRANECRTSEGYECVAPAAIPGGGTGGTTQKYCLPMGAADLGGLGGLLGGSGLGGLLGGQGGGTGGFLAGLGGLLGGLGGAGGN